VKFRRLFAVPVSTGPLAHVVSVVISFFLFLLIVILLTSKNAKEHMVQVNTRFTHARELCARKVVQVPAVG
jgi:hypothetical protein